MTKAVRFHKVGGPQALIFEAVDVPRPGPGEVRIRQRAVGLNHRRLLPHRALQGPRPAVHSRQ